MEHNFHAGHSTKKSVLIVDDEYVNRQLLGVILQDTYTVLYAQNGEEALALIEQQCDTLSLILLDIMMPKLGGFELLKILKKSDRFRQIPVIVLTSDVSAEVESLKLGAADFIKKPYDMPEVIIARANRIIELSEDKTIIQSTEKDPLTNLYTKDFFFEYAKLSERDTTDRSMDAVCIEIDQFQLINDFYGRHHGDMILLRIGETLNALLSKTDGIACRAAGGVFFLFCEHQADMDRFLLPVTRAVEELSDALGRQLHIGVDPPTEEVLSIEERFVRAKTACDSLKKSHSHAFAYYDEALHAHDLYLEVLIQDMKGALDNHDFVVYYQPKYRIGEQGSYLSSAEALVRWKHPKCGLISPGVFVPLFEENGLIHLLDEYVWRETSKQIKVWKEKYNFTLPVSVNVSRIDFYDPRMEENLLHIIEDAGISAEDLILEITESAYSEDVDQIGVIVEALRRHGFKIEMDDFGSGYSSLNMLDELSIDALKLDMKFTRNMQKNKTLRVIEFIVQIAHHLSVPVVAEGVENKEQYEALKKIGCDIIQGYYFSRPVPPEEFEELLIQELSHHHKEENDHADH